MSLVGWIGASLRCLQFIFCLLTLIFVSCGFVATSYYGYSSMLGSSAATYLQLVSFMGMLYALLLLAVVVVNDGSVDTVSRLTLVAMDATLALLLLVGAIVLLVSDYVMHCSMYGLMLHCRNLTTAVVFAFLSMAAFVLSMIATFFAPPDHSHERASASGASHGQAASNAAAGGATSEPYYMEATPKAQESPSARV